MVVPLGESVLPHILDWPIGKAVSVKTNPDGSFEYVEFYSAR